MKMVANKELVKKLQIAAENLRKLVGYQDIMSSYDSAEGLAVFIESQVASLMNNEVTEENLNELWRVFAPTSEWDDYADDIELGESIFKELDLLKRKH